MKEISYINQELFVICIYVALLRHKAVYSAGFLHPRGDITWGGGALKSDNIKLKWHLLACGRSSMEQLVG